MIDFNKIAKYSKSSPRYTSYPTAVEFKENFTHQDYQRMLLDSNSSKIPLSLYIHLPFCKSACYFCGCNVVYTSREDKKDEYIPYLKKEIEILKRYLDTSREVVQLHFGGGTPTFFSANQLKEVILIIRESFPNFSDDAEISCEIDPRFFNQDQMEALKNGGFNRVSFGVQDFDKKVQNAIHRIQSVDLVKDSVKIARDLGIGSINFDLIYGLPFQTIDSFKNTLIEVVKLNPDRLAVFNYAHVPWIKKTMRKINENNLPTPSEKLEILKQTIAFLDSCGYKLIGMDHFAKKDDELYKAVQNKTIRRNFQGYTTKKFSQTIGIGLTSIGEGEKFYAQNHKDLSQYKESLDSGILPISKGVLLSDEDILRKEVIMSLMNNLSLDFKEIESKFDINFREYFKDSLEQLEEYKGLSLLEINESGIYTTPTGGMLIRNIAMVFDEYIQDSKENKFSKTI